MAMSNVVNFPKKEHNRREELLLEVKELKADIERLQAHKTWSLAIAIAIVAGWVVGTLLAQI
jgi:hypothetical protein